MRVHGYSCTACGFYHDHTDAVKRDGELRIKCVDCGYIEHFEPTRRRSSA